MRTFDREITIEIDGEDVEVAVEYTASPIIGATYWQPAEGGEIEILTVTISGTNKEVEFDTEDEERLLDEISGKHNDSEFDESDFSYYA